MAEVRYSQVVMSDRQGKTLAPKYGYGSVLDLAQSLPPDAQVLDVGAGLSTLGRQVCNLRADVVWINADIQYDRPNSRYAERYKALVERRPKNLHYEKADALHLITAFGVEEFDRVFSYEMLPHIILASREEGLVAARNMLRVAKETGHVAVGPVRRPAFSYAAVRGLALDVARSGDPQLLETQAEMLVDANTRGWVGEMMHRFLQEKMPLEDAQPVVLQ